MDTATAEVLTVIKRFGEDAEHGELVNMLLGVAVVVGVDNVDVVVVAADVVVVVVVVVVVIVVAIGVMVAL